MPQQKRYVRKQNLYPLKSIFRQIHSIIPNSLRNPLNITVNSIQDTLLNWRMPAYRVCAPLPSGLGEGTVIYVGNKPQYVSWTHKLFGHAIEPTLLNSLSHYEILRGKHQNLSADITLCPLNALTLPIYSRLGWHVIPLYVNCYVDLNKPITEIVTSRGAKDDLRIARRLGYQFTLLEKSNEAIHEFFHQMLIPTVKKRHEDRAFFSKWKNIEHTYQNGFLIGAYLENQWIGGILLAPEDMDTIRIANIGWRNGEATWLKKGVATALYNQSFIWAQENNFKYVNLGSSNPFANDGPLNFKLKLGANLVVPNFEIEHQQIHSMNHFMGVKINIASPVTQFLLASTPLIEYKEKRLRVIGWNANIPPLFRRQIDLGIEWINLAEIDSSSQTIQS